MCSHGVGEDCVLSIVRVSDYHSAASGSGFCKETLVSHDIGNEGFGACGHSRVRGLISMDGRKWLTFTSDVPVCNDVTSQEQHSIRFVFEVTLYTSQL